MSKIITANHLETGRALYLETHDAWTPDINKAAIARTETEENTLLQAAQKAERENRVIHPALISVDLQDGTIEPLTRIEKIRAKGPTVNTDLGYQTKQEI